MSDVNTAGFKRVKRESVSTLVFNQLIARIVEGLWAKGDRLPSETELTETFGVSRVSIREALQKLVTLGLLETRHGEGTFVCGPTSGTYLNNLLPDLILDNTDIMDVLEYRQIMEKGVAPLVVNKADKAAIRELEFHYDEMVRFKDNRIEFAHADLDFHLAMAKATGNSVIYKVNRIIKDILTASMEKIVDVLGTEDGLFYHRKILDAVISRDAEAAQKLMAEHLERTVHRIQSRKSGT